jgi:hypothetical protein
VAISSSGGSSGGTTGHSYLSSNKNLAGMALAAVGPVLAIAGVVAAPIGLIIAVPLYIAGALVVPSRAKPGVVVIGGVDGDHMLQQLTAVERQVHGKVDPSVEERVARIATTIRETLPRVDSLGPGSSQAHTLVQTVTDYLPDALGTYLKLPRSYAEHQAVSDGKTALRLLNDQLDLLATRMDEVFTAVCQSDADALVAHGRFLDEKFAPGSLDLGKAPAIASGDHPRSATSSAATSSTPPAETADQSGPVLEPPST